MRHARKVLSKALQYALALGLVNRNVARLTKTPKVVHKHNEPWDAADTRQFLAATRVDDAWPLPRADVTREFQAAAERASLRPIRFHDLCHTCARPTLDNGADLRHVMAQLGHSSIATANDIYGGYLEDSRAQASAIMGRVLAGVAER